MSDDLTVLETAEYLDVSVPTLTNWRHRSIGPICWKAPNGRIKYARADLDRYVAARKEATMRGGK